MLTPTPAPELAPASPASPSPVAMDPARAAELRRQLRALALLLFAWTANPPDLARSTASERLLVATFRRLLPRVRDALLSRLEGADPAALEAAIGATATALESLLYYAPGDPLPRCVWRFEADGTVGLVLADAPELPGGPG